MSIIFSLTTFSLQGRRFFFRIELLHRLLDPNKTLTPDELKFIDKVRADVGLPQTGTVMNKIIPQSDIYNYLYNEKYSGVRGFVSVDEHSRRI